MSFAGTGSAGASSPLLWSAHLASAAEPDTAATSVAVSHDGTRVFVAGSASGVTTQALLVAYNAATGARVWTQRISGSSIAFASMVVDASDSRVFVVGTRFQSSTARRFVAYAFDASTGARLWGRAVSAGDGESAVLNGDGTRLYVAGSTLGSTYVGVTAALDVATGETVWLARNRGPGGTGFAPQSVSIDPAGDRIVVGGSSAERIDGFVEFTGYAVVAYDTDGTKLWSARDHSKQIGSAYADGEISPDGAVFVATGEFQTGATVAAVTVAFDVATGAKLWAASYLGPSEFATAARVAFSADGSRAFVAGTVYGAGSDDLLAIAYDAHSGAQEWTTSYNGPANGQDDGGAIAATADGSTVLVTGSSQAARTRDVATLALNTADGTTRWVDRYDSPIPRGSAPAAVAVSPDSSRGFVVGSTNTATGGTELLTLAYALS